LLEPEKFHGRIFELTGSVALSGNDVAKTLQKVMKKDVVYVNSSEKELEWIMWILGVPEFAKEHVGKVFAMARDHKLETVYDSLPQVFGITQTSYEQFVEDLIAGRTGGGSSFEPPNPTLAAVLNTVGPLMTNIKFSLFGRPNT